MQMTVVGFFLGGGLPYCDMFVLGSKYILQIKDSLEHAWNFI